MNGDEEKTEEQLMKEVEELRSRVAELEKVGAVEDLKAANQQLRASEHEISEKEQEWHDSFNSLEDVMLLIDRNFTIEKINKNGLKLLNKQEMDVIGRKCYEVIHGLNTAAEGCPLKKARKTGKVELIDRYEKDLKTHFSIKCSPIFDKNKKIIKFIDLMRDITEQKQAEKALIATNQQLDASNQQLRASEQQLKAANQQLRASEIEIKIKKETAQNARIFSENIISTVREPLVILDKDLRVVSAGRSFYTTFKVSPDETEGQLLFDLGNHQWDIPALRALFEGLLPEKTTVENYEMVQNFETIGQRTMLLNARKIEREEVEELILLTIGDITERKQTEMYLKENINRLERFNKVIVGRELRMAEMKKEMDELLKELGREPIYSSDKDYEREGDQ